ncbi:uncharacterized protein Dwil_GK27593 [Drosophila willistoni]|uniref:Uncharacterized protein n=1 Tax=Drosophila willistoni TaxID=7260 RepID=A0A0Q9WUZ3_DROWI|nr:uncharacterized protein Dwil_GK27593 [Drosophila willistoni]
MENENVDENKTQQLSAILAYTCSPGFTLTPKHHPWHGLANVTQRQGKYKKPIPSVVSGCCNESENENQDEDADAYEDEDKARDNDNAIEEMPEQQQQQQQREEKIEMVGEAVLTHKHKYRAPGIGGKTPCWIIQLNAISRHNARYAPPSLHSTANGSEWWPPRRMKLQFKVINTWTVGAKSQLSRGATIAVAVVAAPVRGSGSTSCPTMLISISGSPNGRVGVTLQLFTVVCLLMGRKDEGGVGHVCAA